MLTRQIDGNGQTALHFTASKNHLDVARKLIATKATTRKKDKRQQLPLHRAAAVGSVPMVKLLLENNSPVNATDIDGWTALHHGKHSTYELRCPALTYPPAISEGHGDAAIALLKAGADHTKINREDMTAMQLAPDTKIAEFIVTSAEREGIDLD
jgi:26S proteasome non-ATPase regulatory subunit 10